MNTSVLVEVSASVEALAADVTDEGFFTSMGKHGQFQLITALEGFVTQVACTVFGCSSTTSSRNAFTSERIDGLERRDRLDILLLQLLPIPQRGIGTVRLQVRYAYC